MRLIIISVLIIVFVSCSKYEDGPSVSLRTKNARLINKWKIETSDTLFLTKADPITPEDSTTGPLYASYIEFQEEGIYYTPPTYGSWDFDEEKQNVIITIDKDSKSYKILKLKNNELWLFYTDSATSIETHFVSYE